MTSKFTLFLMMFVFSNYLALAQDIRVAPNTNITLHSGTTLDIKSGDLVLASDASGDASLIDHGTVAYSGGGETRVERYLTEGKWHLVSSPITGADAGLFLADFLQSHSENTNGWTDIAPENYTLAAMQGYALWSVDAAPTTEEFAGTTHTGPFNKSFTLNGDGWNLMGNPYPSSLDWDAVSKPTGLNEAVWLYDPTIGANGDYVYYINGGGVANTTSQYIASGQGFFVRAISGSGTLAIDNSSRAHSDQAFYKNTDQNTLILKARGNGISSQTAIRFNEDATAEPDRMYDVYKIVPDSPDVPVLYSKSGEEKMAINTLPDLTGNEIVPVWFSAGTKGTYKIFAEEIASFNMGTPLYLEDVESGNLLNLRVTPEYEFSYQTEEEKSFLVYFTEPDGSSKEAGINVFASVDGLQVNFPASELLTEGFEAQIEIFDLTGKSVLQRSTSSINNLITFNGNEGIYMVRVTAGDRVINQKVFLK